MPTCQSFSNFGGMTSSQPIFSCHSLWRRIVIRSVATMSVSIEKELCLVRFCCGFRVLATNIDSMEHFCGQLSIKNSRLHSMFSVVVCAYQRKPGGLDFQRSSAKRIIFSELWWSGRHWLSLSLDHWPYRMEFVRQVDLPGTRADVLLESQIEDFQLWRKYSRFDRLLRVVAWCKRLLLMLKDVNERLYGS